MTIQTVKMSLFDAPPRSVLVHACNCQGVWGSGVALEFHKRFPFAYDGYQQYCKMHGNEALGTAALFHDNGYWIGCLMTSRGYGASVDPVEEILASTGRAVEYFFQTLDELVEPNIYSNKFNSGLFRVPWSETEQVLQHVLANRPQINWTVCEHVG